MRRFIQRLIPVLALLMVALSIAAQTNAPAASDATEQTRNACIQNRRHICGRVLKIEPGGLVIDSGYTTLLAPPYNQSWLVRGTASLHRDPALIEQKSPDCAAIGEVFLVNYPKRPPVKAFDYVVIRGYPAGEQTYTPAPGVEKKLRRFSASLDRAVEINLRPAK